MSSPAIWVGLPGLLAVFLMLVRKYEKLVSILGTIIALVLAGLSIIIPVGEIIQLGNLSLEITDTLTILGRRFVISADDKFLLTLIYTILAFWFGGAIFAHTTRMFVPLGLGIAAIFTAALSVEPFLYGPLLIEMAVLVSVPLLANIGKPVGRGILRYLTFQTLGFPFILFTGWLLAGVESSPGNSNLILLANLLMAMGFAFMLGVFPFHTWIPMLAEESHPYTAAFILFQVPMVVMLFGLNLIDRYVWLRSSIEILLVIQAVAITMILIGGLMAAFQRHLGRIFGFAVMVEIGFSLIALVGGLNDPETLGLYFAALIPRAISFGVWALALVTISLKIAGGDDYSNVSSSHLHFRAVQGVARRLPVAVLGLMLSIFSIVSLPLLAGFPLRQALMYGLAGRSILATAVVMVGVSGLLVGGLRSLAVLVMGQTPDPWRVEENTGEKILMILGGIALLIVGIFPQWFTSYLVEVVQVYTHIGR